MARLVECARTMKRAVVLVLVCGLFGCHSKRAKYAGAGATVVAGIVAIAIAPSKERCVYSEDLFDFSGELCDVGQDLRAMLLVTGVALLTTGLLYTAVISAPPAPPRDGPLDEKIVIRLTAQAALAARNGDCISARALVDRIARRDATVVIDDTAIARCLK
jgi:hypothetical protein